jgi:hypothetical protein
MHTLEEVDDDILVPALTHAKQDRENDFLAERDTRNRRGHGDASVPDLYTLRRRVGDRRWRYRRRDAARSPDLGLSDARRSGRFSSRPGLMKWGRLCARHIIV